MQYAPKGDEVRSGLDRRQIKDRREEIRFEPQKKDRRKNDGRRKDDNDLWTKAIRESDAAAE